MTRSKSRREVLLGAAALAGTASLPRVASAQTKGRIVVGTWGGDYARLLNKNIEAPLLIKDGWEVVQDQAGDPERRSKILAEMRLPRGTTDVQGLSAINMFQMHDAGSVLPIDYGKLKNAGNLLPAMKYPYGVGHIYSGKVVLYNPDMMAAPAGFADTLDPKHGEKLGIIDTAAESALLAVSGVDEVLANGLLVLVALVTSGSFAEAATITWKNSAGGDWATAANWNPSVVPGPTDTALFAEYKQGAGNPEKLVEAFTKSEQFGSKPALRYRIALR